MVRESSELILSWDGDVAFPFDAGALCLELLTTGGAANYPGYEALRTPEDLAGWLAGCRLGIAGVRVSSKDLADAHQLRGAVWGAAHARIAGRALPQPAVATINELAAPAPPIPRLARAGRSWAATIGRQALSAIARDAVDLFGGPHAERVRECASTNCSLVFVDLSRPGLRRWCSMERCGNRAKQRVKHGRSQPR